ncbi:kinetochore-associated Ndc80 complex subunit ndc80 [Tieghemiomyces parasiticus]|uniref:Kinetochore protein NDC80 n=1 Tax=Tieghemiomyces parasiticus TaxID=78921 RepID=A0A9W8E2I4_9FUNG|nr:kinetochore-associated Ndc80 complex subunit ndc80 [Tieghemiomyces parasiticus]
MNPRRRTMLGSLDPNQHYGQLPPSGIPHPSATKTRFSIAPTAAGRMSMEPMRGARPVTGHPYDSALGANVTPAHQKSVHMMGGGGGGGPVRPSTVQRPSLAFTPAGLSRRTSTYTGRPSTMASLGLLTRSSSAGMKDPRAIRTNAFQQASGNAVYNFLTQAGYADGTLKRFLMNPTVKEYQQIFKFVYARLDPNYLFQKKFEEEIQTILRGLRYPFLDTIQKTSFTAISSKLAWPHFLAILHWMVELVVCVDRLAPSNPDFFSPEFQDTPAFSEQVFFEYLSKTYPMFLAYEDSFEGPENELAEIFESKNKHLIESIETLETDNEALRQELRQLTEHESPLVALTKERQGLEEDRRRCLGYTEETEKKKVKLTAHLEELKRQLEGHTANVEQLREERRVVQETVDAQEISPADIDRMNGERQKLSEVLQDLNGRLEELNRAVWQKEIDVQPKIDTIEQLVQEFNTRCYKLGITTAAGGAGVLNELQFDPTASVYEKMLSYDVKRVGRPVLADWRMKLNSKFIKTENDRMTLLEELDAIREAMQEKQDTLNDLEAQRARLETKFAEEKEVSIKTAARNSEIDLLEREIARLQQSNVSSVLHWQQKAQSATMDFNRLSGQAAERKQAATAELIKGLTDVVSFKGYIEKHLSELQTLSQAELELSRELTDLETEVRAAERRASQSPS